MVEISTKFLRWSRKRWWIAGTFPPSTAKRHMYYKPWIPFLQLYMCWCFRWIASNGLSNEPKVPLSKASLDKPLLCSFRHPTNYQWFVWSVPALTYRIRWHSHTADLFLPLHPLSTPRVSWAIAWGGWEISRRVSGHQQRWHASARQFLKGSCSVQSDRHR